MATVGALIITSLFRASHYERTRLPPLSAAWATADDRLDASESVGRALHDKLSNWYFAVQHRPQKLSANARWNGSPTIRRGRYLFLQGPPSPFFSRLAHAVAKRGHDVFRINLNGGDRFFWRLPGALDYRKEIDEWAVSFRDIATKMRVTDVILFGDCRPHHRIAIAHARRLGLRVHVFEEGYLRPDWITLEADGVNHLSSLPRDPEWYLQAAAHHNIPNRPLPVKGRFALRALYDVLYTLSTVLLQWRYPSYRTHKPWHPLAEYAAGARRFPLRWLRRRHDLAFQQSILSSRRPYYVVPLQLDADSQIRWHSPFGAMAPAIKTIIESFARAAPKNALLVLTEHPLDTGLVPLERFSRDYADEASVGDRVIFARGGTSEDLLKGASGVVTVNSTTGLRALSLALPVITLGHALYNMPSITFQGGLDRFWSNSTAPDRTVFDSFVRVLTALTQINGHFYSENGITLAVEEAVVRLESELKVHPQSHPENPDPQDNDMLATDPAFAGRLRKLVV